MRGSSAPCRKRRKSVRIAETGDSCEGMPVRMCAHILSFALGVSYTGSTLVLGTSRRSSILRTPTTEETTGKRICYPLAEAGLV